MPFLSDFGLVNQGMDGSRLVNDRLAQNKQRLADEQQMGVLRGQAIEHGKIGLEEVSRARDSAAAERAAVAGSDGMDQTYDAVGKARRASGNMAGVEDANTKRQQNQVRALVDLAHDATVGTDPRQAEEKFRRAGFGQDAEPGSMTFGMNPETKDTMVLFKDKSGQPHAINATNIIRQSSKMEMKILPAGSVGVEMGPGGATGRTITTPKTFAENPQHGYIKKTVKNDDGSEREQIIDVRPGSPTYGQEVAPDAAGGAGAAPGGGSSPKNLPTIKAIEDAVKEQDGMWKPGKVDPNDPAAVPVKVLTPKGEEVTIVASQLWEANKRTMNHQTAISLAKNGKAMLNRSTGEMAWEAGGKRYKMSQTPGEAVQQPAPAAPVRNQNDMPKVKPGTPADASVGDPVPAPAVAAPQTAATTPSTGTAQEIFDKEGITGVLARLEKSYPPKDAISGGRSGSTKRKVDSPEVAEFKKKKGREALAYADSLLSKRQVAGYQRGGKVQRHGLG
jgi:hypothetical protein